MGVFLRPARVVPLLGPRLHRLPCQRGVSLASAAAAADFNVSLCFKNLTSEHSHAHVLPCFVLK